MKVLIVGAMNAEIEAIRSTYDVVGTMPCFGVELAIAKTPLHDLGFCEMGIGKVNAAYAVRVLLSLFQPDVVINIGTSGNLSSDLKLGDVVIGSSTRYWDVDVTQFGYALGQIPKMPAQYELHQGLQNLALAASLHSGRHLYRVTSGALVSGDSFVSDLSLKQTIQKNFPEAVALDMESTAIAQVCHLAQVPLCVIRSVTDGADGDAAMSHEAFLKISSANAGDVVRHLLNDALAF